MFQYTEPLYSASNDPIKPSSFTTATTRPGQHYPYDPEFYHNSTAVSWQPPNYSEVQPTVDYPGSSHSLAPSRPRITTSLWDDEGTVCYQVDVRGICVARRQDNDMINGTKLLNVTGMSRGKRDGILKNEKGRVVVKVGAMHLKGVWVTFARAKALAIQYTIVDYLYPLFVDDPAMYFYSNQLTQNYFIPNHPIYLQSQDSFTHNTHSYKNTINNDNNDNTNNNNHQHRQHHHSNENTATTNTTNIPTTLTATPISTTMAATAPSSTAATTLVSVSNIMNEPLMNYPIFSNHYYLNQQPIIEGLPPAPSVPSMLPYSDDARYYA